jgi:hypothetical protein
LEQRAGGVIFQFLKATNERVETKYVFLDFYQKSKNFEKNAYFFYSPKDAKSE